MRRSMITIAFLLTATALLAGDKPKAAATIGRAVITEEDVNREIGNRLMKIRTEEYNIRRGALETLIEERLLAEEAARRKITVEELLQREIESQVPAPPLAEIEPFYEASRDRFANLTPEEAIQQIAANMRGQQIAKQRDAFVAALRASAGVKVLIEPPRATVEATGPSKGAAAAPVTIVEFSDFECSACGRAAPTLKRVAEKYGDSVRIVYRDFPLQIHRGAARAAEAAHCAGDEGKFWLMHDKLFSRGGGPVQDADIRKYATDLGLDAEKFADCLQSGRHTGTWKASQAEGIRAGVVSTPTFFINGRMIPGAAPLEIFTRIIDEELARAGSPRTVTASP